MLRLRALRVAAALAAVVAVAVAAAAMLGGCGSKYDLPTELRITTIPPEKSYATRAIWTGMDRVRDILLTQKFGSQLFVCFEKPTPDTTSSGDVYLFPLTRGQPILSTRFLHLFNPVALAAGGDGTGAPLNRVFVLDQGDTCVARRNPISGGCAAADTVGGWTHGVSDLRHYWRVGVYGLLGGDTISTFTDTTVAWVDGIAADDRGRVYVACQAIILEPNPFDPNIKTRQHQSRIYRYIPGPRWPGNPYDHLRLPGANWHRDSLWQVVEGTGVGSVQGPRGLDWITSPTSALYCADYDKNWVQKLNDTQPGVDEFALDGVETGTFLFQAPDVAADEQGFIYICDTGNKRVLRYGPDKTFIQRVDTPGLSDPGKLVRPVAVAANDTLVFIADPGAARIYKMLRLQ